MLSVDSPVNKGKGYDPLLKDLLELVLPALEVGAHAYIRKCICIMQVSTFVWQQILLWIINHIIALIVYFMVW